VNEKLLREQLKKLLGSGEAHVSWKAALQGLSTGKRGTRPPGAPRSAWEILEHVRIAQWDILEFCRNPKHISPEWPSGYWPVGPQPPSAAAWKKSAKAFQRDTNAMGKLVADPQADLTAPIAHGSGQTILREVFLLADHNAYHLGQYILLRRLLGSWKET